MKQISLLGCGWLGLPLAKSLLQKGFTIKGSTTSLDKITILDEAGIIPFLVTLSAVEMSLKMNFSIEKFLENSKILIIDIPPKLRGNDTENFVKKIENTIPFIEKSTIEKVLFVSSTSVYPDALLTDGNPNIVTEETKPQPDTESGKQLLETENLLLNNSNFQTTILRFGGLIGENRHPIHFLAGRKNIQNPEAKINLIHQLDCIGIIEKIVSDCFVPRNDFQIEKETFNAVAPFHPTRKDYYIAKAIELHLPEPEFENTLTNFGKTISSNKIETVLNYKFQKPKL